MGRRHQKLFDVVVLDGLHTLDALASAVLSLRKLSTVIRLI